MALIRTHWFWNIFNQTCWQNISVHNGYIFTAWIYNSWRNTLKDNHKIVPFDISLNVLVVKSRHISLMICAMNTLQTILKIYLIEEITNQYTFGWYQMKILLLDCIINTVRIFWVCVFSVLVHRKHKQEKNVRLPKGPSGAIGAIEPRLPLPSWYQL